MFSGISIAHSQFELFVVILYLKVDVDYKNLSLCNVIFFSHDNVFRLDKSLYKLVRIVCQSRKIIVLVQLSGFL